MRLSKQLFQDRWAAPAGWAGMQSYKLFEQAGFVEFPQSGFPVFLPLGKRVMDRIAALIRDEAERAGFTEIALPLVQNRDLMASTGRAEVFGDEFFAVQGRADSFLLAPTNEEFFLNLAARGVTSYRQLPVRCFQIADKFRDIRKPKGILRSKQFLMCDMVSLDETPESLRDSAATFERLVDSVFARMEMAPLRVEKNEGKYVDYLVPCAEGETIVRADGGAAAYAERGEAGAVTASSVAMYFIFEEQGGAVPSFAGRGGTRREIYLGTYGFGLQRCFHGAVEVHRDELGIALPAAIRPFDVALLALDAEDAAQGAAAAACYDRLLGRGVRVLLDDRHGRTYKEKASLADFLGVPVKVVIGRREAAEECLTVKRRGDSREWKLPLASDWPDHLASIAAGGEA